MFIIVSDVTAIASSLVTLLQKAITVSHLLSNQVQRVKKKKEREREQIDKFKQGMLWQKKSFFDSRGSDDLSTYGSG